MAVILFNKLDEEHGIVACGGGVLAPARGADGEPGKVSVSPSQARYILEEAPERWTMERAEAMGDNVAVLPAGVRARPEDLATLAELAERHATGVIYWWANGAATNSQLDKMDTEHLQRVAVKMGGAGLSFPAALAAVEEEDVKAEKARAKAEAKAKAKAAAQSEVEKAEADAQEARAKANKAVRAADKARRG